MSEDLHVLQQKLQQIQNKFSDIEQAYQDLLSKFDQIDKLYAISSQFGAITDLEQLVRLTEKLFTEQIPVDSFYLYRLDNAENSVSLLVESEVSKSGINISTELNSPFWAALIHRGELSYIKNLKKSHDPGLDIEASGSLLRLPLMSDEVHIAGILILHRKEKEAFSIPELNLLKKISEHMAFALNKTLLYEHTKVLSITDSLTGIYNRRHFAQRFEWELQRSKRYKRSVSLILLDIDHFKHYNDINGHLKGDLILIQIARILSAQLRKADIIARYGGEEFIILLPETNQEQAVQVAEKLRKRIERERFDLAEKQPDGKITASLGIANHPEDASEPEHLINMADKALYAAKSRGRNCVVVFREKENTR